MEKKLELKERELDGEEKVLKIKEKEVEGKLMHASSTLMKLCMLGQNISIVPKLNFF